MYNPKVERACRKGEWIILNNLPKHFWNYFITVEALDNKMVLK